MFLVHITSILMTSAKVLDLSKLTDAESAQDCLAGWGREVPLQVWVPGLVLMDLKPTLSP